MPSVDRFVPANGIRLHVIDHAGGNPPVVLLPGLSSNAHAFDGLVTAGLGPHHRVLAFDLRGRAQSDKPASGYSMADHAADVLGVLDRLGLGSVVIGGHSFGGLLSIYLAANEPERVDRAVIIDASAAMHPEVRDLIEPSIARLRWIADSESAYLDGIRSQPYLGGFWDSSIETYYRAEVQVMADGRVRSSTSADAIAQALDQVLAEPWSEHVARIEQPTLVINATEGFGPPGSPPVQPPDLARVTVAALARGRYAAVPGNHLTMLFGSNAAAVAAAIRGFLAD